MDLKVGDHVISCFISACGKCRYCLRWPAGIVAIRASKTTTTLPDGTLRIDAIWSWQDHCNVLCGCGVMACVSQRWNVDSVVKIDRDVPLDRAALVGCSVMTGFGAATRTAQVEPGSIAVVFGAGGVGLNVIQGCVLSGAAMIVAVDVSPEKLETARSFGATHTINAAERGNVVKAVRALTQGGADYSFECVGRGEIISQPAYGCCGRAARLSSLACLHR